MMKNVLFTWFTDLINWIHKLTQLYLFRVRVQIGIGYPMKQCTANCSKIRGTFSLQAFFISGVLNCVRSILTECIWVATFQVYLSFVPNLKVCLSIHVSCNNDRDHFPTVSDTSKPEVWVSGMVRTYPFWTLMVNYFFSLSQAKALPSLAMQAPSSDTKSSDKQLDLRCFTDLHAGPIGQQPKAFCIGWGLHGNTPSNKVCKQTIDIATSCRTQEWNWNFRLCVCACNS